MSNEDKVREAAYFIWLNNGCPEGVEIDCWLEAEVQEGGKECECACEEKPAKKAPAKKAAAKKDEEKPAKKAPAKKAAAKK